MVGNMKTITEEGTNLREAARKYLGYMRDADCTKLKRLRSELMILYIHEKKKCKPNVYLEKILDLACDCHIAMKEINISKTGEFLKIKDEYSLGLLNETIDGSESKQ